MTFHFETGGSHPDRERIKKEEILEQRAEDIFMRVWSRSEDTPETRLSEEEALFLLERGDDAYSELVGEEIENDRLELTPKLSKAFEEKSGEQLH